MRILVLASAALIPIGCGKSPSEAVSDRTAEENPIPKRMVSTAPSLTETAFALGLGPKIVGVSRFCEYPPEATSLPKIGGHLDPNLEAIVTLQPDLVLVLQENTELIARLEKLGISTHAVCHRTIDGILDSFSSIGRRCGAERRANELRTSIEARLAEIEEKTEGRGRPRVLVAVDRSRESDRLSDIYIAGNNPFFVEAVRLAGGVNVGKDLTMAFPVVSVEGILRMKPEVIIELGTGESIGPETKATWKDDWQSLGDGIPAVREGRVFIFSESYATVPGPRFILLIEALARRLHPDIIDRKGTIR